MICNISVYSHSDVLTVNFSDSETDKNVHITFISFLRLSNHFIWYTISFL